MKLITIFFLLLLCSCTFTGCGQPINSVSAARSPENINPGLEMQTESQNQYLTGLYYGTSTKELDRKVWLFRIGTDHSYLYSLPTQVKLGIASERLDGTFGFRTEPNGDGIVYEFQGKETKGRLEGNFTIVSNGETLEAISNYEVVLNRIDINDLRTDIKSGVYSNLRYNNESGDLNGAEIVLIALKNKIIGCVMLHENGLVPRPFIAQFEDGKIVANVQFLKDLRKIHIEPQGNAVKLSTFVAGGKLESVTLHQTSDLNTFLVLK